MQTLTFNSVFKSNIPRRKCWARAYSAPDPKIDYGTFVRKVEKNEVLSVNIKPGDNTVTLYDKSEGKYKSNIILSEELLDDMVNHDVKIFIENQDTPVNLFPLFTLIPLAVYFLFMSSRSNNPIGQLNPMNNKLEFNKEIKTNVTFDDVAGVDEVKEEVKEIIDFLKQPSKFTSSGAKIPKGCILYGSPGTGKTLLAKAIAGEADVPFLACSASQFIELFVGLGAKRIRTIFENARKEAPCILFIDEIDAIGKKRGNNFAASGGNDEREQTLNQLLTEMDGFEDNSGVIVIAATNRVDILDDALVRPGRFDRKIALPLPDVNGREQILKVHAQNKNIDNVDIRNIAKKTTGRSGAELENIMNEAAINAARYDRTTITNEDVNEAYEKQLIGIKKKMSYTTDQKITVAYHEAGHALIGYILKDFDTIEKVTIIPRGGSGGVTLFVPDENTIEGWYTKEYLEHKIMTGLGGHAAEELIYGKQKVTTGAVSDFQQVSNIASAMVKQYGFSDIIGKISLDNVSPSTAKLIDDEINLIVNGLYTKTINILKSNIQNLDSIANALVDKETLTGDEIEYMINKRMDIKNLMH